jgi:nucleotide-binding universal stress UspA family protein
MTIKSILLHLGSSRHFEELLACAASLADAHGACIDVLYTTLPLHAPASLMRGRGGTGGYISDRAAQALENAEIVRARVAEVLGGYSWTWEISDDDHADALAERAATADLVIVPQAHPDEPEEWVQVQHPEDMVLREPVPALVVPWKAKGNAAMDRVMIAWNGTAGVMRAARGVLPLLSVARSVDVVYLGDDNAVIAKAEKLMIYLGRHGIAADMHVITPDGSLSDAILRYAGEHDINLMITGAHGHSRLHELVFGSTTHQLLENIGVPTIICH